MQVGTGATFWEQVVAARFLLEPWEVGNTIYHIGSHSSFGANAVFGCLESLQAVTYRHPKLSEALDA